MNRKNNASSLLELIIVLLILAILLLIGFISYVGYLSTARNASRVYEFKEIETSMYTYILNKGFFPNPSNPVNISYSGGIAWIQGTFTNDISNIIGYNNGVKDPLTEDLYTYSIKNSGKEFSVAGVLEKSSEIVYNNGFIGNTYAAEIGSVIGTALVGGNYNGEILSVNNGVTNYILAIPSIVASDLSSNNLVDIINNNKLVYNNFENLPLSYGSGIYDLDANLDFRANNLVVFTGSIVDLNDTSNRVTLLQNLYNAYSGSIIGDKISVTKIDSVELFTAEPSNTIKILACDLVNYKLKYPVECK